MPPATPTPSGTPRPSSGQTSRTPKPMAVPARPAPLPAGATPRPGTARVVKPAAPGVGSASSQTPAASRPGAGSKGTARIVKPAMVAPEHPTAPGKYDRAYYIKLGALLSVPLLLVLLLGMLAYRKFTEGPPAEIDPNTGKPAIAKAPITVDPTKVHREQIDQGFTLRQKAMTSGDPAEKKKLLREALALMKQGLEGYRRIFKQFPGDEYGLKTEIDRIEKNVAALEKDVNPPVSKKPEEPKEYTEAMNVKKDAQKKYASSFDEKDVEKKKEVLLDAISLLENVKKRLKRCKDGVNDDWKGKCDSEISACDQVIQACNQEIEHAAAAPPESPKDN